jgi:hypothetical protein
MSISPIAARFGGVSLAAALLLGPGVAWADSPHFISATGGIDSTTGDYTASWKEAGLGKTPITYELDVVTTSYTFQCFNKGGNRPHGAPNAGGGSDLNTSGTFTPHNGQITASLTLDVTFPPLAGVNCTGGGLQLCLTAASYSGVTLTDVTTVPNVTASLPDGSVSGLKICTEN